MGAGGGLLFVGYVKMLYFSCGGDLFARGNDVHKNGKVKVVMAHAIT